MQLRNQPKQGIYVYNNGQILFFLFFSINFTTFSFSNFLISSVNEYLIKRKITKSLINAPRPPINPAKRIFCSLASTNKTAVAGAEVNPYA